MGLTPEQFTKCVLLEIRLHQSKPNTFWTVWKAGTFDFLIDPAKANNVGGTGLIASAQLRYITADEAIEDYAKNKDKYRWM